MRKGQFKSLEETGKHFLLLQESQVGQGCANCLRCLSSDGNSSVHPQMEPAQANRRVAFIGCPHGPPCREIFCFKCYRSGPDSNNCTHTPGSCLNWHDLICPARSTLMKEFYEYCGNSMEAFLMAAKMMAKLVSMISRKDSDSDCDSADFTEQFVPVYTWSELAARLEVNHPVFYDEFIQRVTQLDDQVLDTWRVLRAHFFNEAGTLKQTPFSAVVNHQKYVELLATVQRHACPVSTGKGIFNFKYDVPAALETICARYREHFSDEISFRQFDSKNISSETPSEVFQYSGFLVSPIFTQFAHSCVPNSQLEVDTNCTLPKYGYVVLRAMDTGEELNMTTIPLSLNIFEREEAIMKKSGRICVCPRCSWERKEYHMVSYENMKQLARQAQEQGRHEEAEVLLHCMVLQDPTDADVLHSYGVVLLNQGQWKLAHEVFGYAFDIDSTHHWLAQQVMKDQLYRPYVRNIFQARIITIRTIASDEIYLTTSQSLCEFCLGWIAKAELASRAKGGWNQRRHKSVATTDLPIHEVPEILDEWNLAFEEIIGPFIQERFRAPAGRMSLHVHDAFVVKYDYSSGQRYLPVHTDQGQFSLTLALNDCGEYSGGGTVFPSNNNIVIRPKCGDFVVFRSSLPHGGLHITSGTRYIIVAFLYIVSRG